VVHKACSRKHRDRRGREKLTLVYPTQLSEDAPRQLNKLLGQYACKQTNAQIAQLFGWYETLGLGIEFDSRTARGCQFDCRCCQQAAAVSICYTLYMFGWSEEATTVCRHPGATTAV